MKKHLRIRPSLLLAVALVGFTIAQAVPHRTAAAAGVTYYVAPGASGTTCTLASPCPLNTGLGKLAAGDTLYLRGGAYYQAVNISHSGSAGAYITVAGYPGESAVVDGQAQVGDPLVGVNGAYVELKDIIIQNSSWTNLSLNGSYDIATHITSHHAHTHGIRATKDHQIIQNCQVHDNSLISENGQSSGYTTGISGMNTANLTIRNNVVWNNWGEGINPYDNTNVLVENNVSYDNLRMNYLVDSEINGVFRNNLSYVTPNNRLSGYPYDQQGGFVYEEEPDEINSARGNLIVNNLSVGGKYGFNYYYYKAGSGLIDTLIANNTFVANGHEGYAAMRFTPGGTHSNTSVYNNLMVQDGTDPIAAVPSGMSGVSFDYNLWATTPVSAARGPHDVIGNPLLSRSSSLTPGNLTADWFRLQAGSPAIDKALVLSQVVTDYFGVTRGPLPDIGGAEYTGGTVPTPTIASTATSTAPSATPTATATSTPGGVSTPSSSASSATYISVGTADGQLIESAAGSGVGSYVNATGATVRLGDDASNRQYRVILSFDTSGLPNTAVIQSVTLKTRNVTTTGSSSNPFASMGKIAVDVETGAFGGSTGLASEDFQATASKNGALTITNSLSNSWYSAAMPSANYGYINKSGTTQMRLRFTTATNNNGAADYISLVSGDNTTTSYRPELVITYTVP